MLVFCSMSDMKLGIDVIKLALEKDLETKTKASLNRVVFEMQEMIKKHEVAIKYKELLDQ